MHQEPERQPEDIAIWRFGIISPLLHRDPEGFPLYMELEKLAGRDFTAPGGRLLNFSADTLRHWLYLFRKRGLTGLYIKVRKDKGTTSLSPELQQAIKEERIKYPAWTIKRIMLSLEKKKVWNSKKPSLTSIYRFSKNHKLNRNPVKPVEESRSFEYANFGELWVADFLHGPKVKVGRTEKKCYLHAIIDDATRYIVQAEFHLAEDTRATLSDLMQAVRRFGVPKRFYTDNGSAFRSKHLAHVEARLSITLHNTTAGRPNGRGKIERVFRTMRDGFITGRGRTSLKKINEDLNKWISEYHARVHSALNMSPLNKKIHATSNTRELAAVENIDALFRMETMKNIYSNGCIRLSGYLYDVPQALPGTKIKVSYLPWDLSVVYVGDEMEPVRFLDKNKNAHRFNKPNNNTNNKRRTDK